jgi:hypothetical protein
VMKIISPTEGSRNLTLLLKTSVSNKSGDGFSLKVMNLVQCLSTFYSSTYYLQSTCTKF